MNIELLVDHQYLISELAELSFYEFGYLVPGKTLQDYIRGFEAHLNSNKFPITFVIVENTQLVGTFSLRKSDMNTHQHLSPWIGSVLVHPSRRGMGVGTFLVKNAKMKVKELGYDCLYLFTPNKAAWYTKLGWEVLEQTFFYHTAVTVMKTSLTT